MLRRYKKIKGDSRLQRRKIEDISSLYMKPFNIHVLLSSISIYLPLSPFNSLASGTCESRIN